MGGRVADPCNHRHRRSEGALGAASRRGTPRAPPNRARGSHAAA